MEHILDSLGHLYGAIATWQWACIVAIFVFCIVLDKVGYFFGIGFTVVFAWLMRDLTPQVQVDPSYQWAFTAVLLAGMAYAIYVVFHGARRSGW